MLAITGVQEDQKHSKNSNPVTKFEIQKAVMNAYNRGDEIPIELLEIVKAIQWKDRENERQAHRPAASSQESVSISEEQKQSESSVDID